MQSKPNHLPPPTYCQRRICSRAIVLCCPGRGLRMEVPPRYVSQAEDAHGNINQGNEFFPTCQTPRMIKEVPSVE